MKRAAKFLLFFVFLEICYIVGTSIFLNGGGLKKLINSDPSEILIEWERAFSPLPGFVMLKNVSGRIQDGGMQLYFQMPSTHVGVWLPDLLRRKFTTTSIRGTELSFRLRMRRPAKEVLPSHYLTLPPIPGLPSITRDAVEKPPGTGEPWHLHLGGISLDHVKEVWIEEYRYAGKARITGGFALVPGRSVEVFPAYVGVEDGAIFLGANRIADALKTNIRGRIKETLTEDPNDNMLTKFSGNVAAETKIDNMRFLNYYLRRVPWIHLDGGAGELKMDVKLSDGSFGDESFLKLTSRNIEAHLWRQIARGQGITSWLVKTVNGQLRTSLSVEFEDYEVTHAQNENSKITGKDLKLTVTSPDVKISDGFSRLGVRIQIPEATISSLRYFNAYIPRSSGIRVLDGTGSIRGEMQADVGSNNDHGDITIRGEGAKLRYDKLTLQGDISVRAQLNSGSMETRLFDVGGTKIDLKNVIAINDGEKVNGEGRWWGLAEVAEGKLRIGPPASIKGKLRVEGKDVRPILGMFTASLPSVIRNMLSFDGLKAAANVFITDQRFSVDQMEAVGKGMSLRGWMDKVQHRRKGGVLLSLGPIAAGLELNNDSVEVKLNDAYQWYDNLAARRDSPE